MAVCTFVVARCCARLRTSVANDENQIQGDPTDRVDEGPGRGDNALKKVICREDLLNEAPPRGPSNLEKGEKT